MAGALSSGASAVTPPREAGVGRGNSETVPNVYGLLETKGSLENMLTRVAAAPAAPAPSGAPGPDVPPLALAADDADDTSAALVASDALLSFCPANNSSVEALS